MVAEARVASQGARAPALSMGQAPGSTISIAQRAGHVHAAEGTAWALLAVPGLKAISEKA